MTLFISMQVMAEKDEMGFTVIESINPGMIIYQNQLETNRLLRQQMYQQQIQQQQQEYFQRQQQNQQLWNKMYLLDQQNRYNH